MYTYFVNQAHPTTVVVPLWAPLYPLYIGLQLATSQ